MTKYEGTWRDDSSLTSVNSYKRKFAFLPVRIIDRKIWLKFYYKKYRTWYHKHHITYSLYDKGHTEFIELMSEEDYMIQKLSDTL